MKTQHFFYPKNIAGSGTASIVPKKSFSSKSILVLVMMLLLGATPGFSEDLKVMVTGLGSGTITSAPAGINCGGDCTETFINSANITLTAIPAAGSVFVRWEGDATGALPTTPIISMNIKRSVRAVFDVAFVIPPLLSFTPTDIQTYLAANPQVNTPARFIRALPAEFKQNWILMPRSESLQTGTAEYPRILMPNANATAVFTIGLVEHGSFPGSHPNAIEYMQWDPAQKNFRFHEIVLNPIPAMPSAAVPTFPARSRGVKIDDAKCAKCHSTRNVLNSGPFIGTNGIPPGSIVVKNKPNWDAYDSWAGMLPFNRDRIYQGSIEAAAFRFIFNLWNWQSNPSVREVIEQLELQPPGVPVNHRITRENGGEYDGRIRFAFDPIPVVVLEPLPIPGVSINTNYNFDALIGVGALSPVIRGGQFVSLCHSLNVGIANGEGRGVDFFDRLGGLDGNLNQQRVANEIATHRFATGSHPIDVRPIALAIAKGLLSISGATVQTNGALPTLTVDQSFFTSRNGMAVNALFTDTDTRAKSLPRRKADLQNLSLTRTNSSNDPYLSISAPANGLIQQYGAATTAGNTATVQKARQEVFRRPIDAGTADATVMGAIAVDRELYSQNTTKMTLFRYFLEPLGVSVDKWSMGVRGRSRTYTFADIFGSYTNTIVGELQTSMNTNPVPGFPNAASNNTDLINAVNSTLGTLPPVNEVPRYTDVQRIFNKSCIECHGGLEYPPYSNYGNFLDLSENENPPLGEERETRAHTRALAYTTNNPATSSMYNRLIDASEDCPFGMMPCGGPALSKTDIETVRRWIVGTRPFTHGDPHIQTVDGISYDFQADGEFTLLRDPSMEIQMRQSAVTTNGPLGPNAHTGLTTCVSLNTAIAVKIGKHRITYQPNLNGEPDPSGLQLRIDGQLMRMPPNGIPLSNGGRVMPTTAAGGIQIEAQGGAVIVVTPGWWAHYQVWYLNLDTRNIRATEGIMGIVSPGNWLPAMPDGTLLGAMPRRLGERYEILYNVFGKAWQVTGKNSLFDYGRDTSVIFSNNEWPNGEMSKSCIAPKFEKSPQKQLAEADAIRLTANIKDEARRKNAIFDIMLTGEEGFARTYLAADKIAQNKFPSAPTLTLPKNFDQAVALPIDFKWEPSTDEDGDTLKSKVYIWPVNEMPNNNNAVPVATTSDPKSKCPLWAALAGLLLFLLLWYFKLLSSAKSKAIALAIVILTVAIIYYLCNQRENKSGSNAYAVKDLKSGQEYFWKVITEDGKGGTVESETRRFKVI